MRNKLYIWSSMKFHTVNSHNCIKVKKNQYEQFCPLWSPSTSPKGNLRILNRGDIAFKEVKIGFWRGNILLYLCVKQRYPCTT